MNDPTTFRMPTTSRRPHEESTTTERSVLLSAPPLDDKPKTLGITRVKNMNAQKTPQNVLEDIRVNMKLAALWASFMFLYIYVDYFHLLMPGSIEGILAGKVSVFNITQVFLLAVLASVTIPALMIFLSVALSAKVNRWTNIIVAAVYIPYTLVNLAGGAWMHMVFGAVVEVVLLLLIIRYAWKWPGIERAGVFKVRAA